MNIATHKISLWIENTEALYQSARDMIREDMRAGRVWDAGTALSDWFETECDENSVNDFAWSILSDLMGAVDWDMIAESVWGDGEEDDTDDDSDAYDWDTDPDGLLRNDREGESYDPEAAERELEYMNQYV